MKVSFHIYKDYRLRPRFAAATDEEALAKLNRRQKMLVKRRRYSFVSLCYHPNRQTLFVGATHRMGDLLLEFNPSAGRFRSCGYARSGLWEPHEAKIHKGLWLDQREDALYFGTATLDPLPQTIAAPGGKLVRYYIASGRFERLAAPTPGDYYQGTVYDGRRRLIYMFTARGCFAVYDIRRKKLARYFPMRSIPHASCLDDDGCVWGTYGPFSHAFFRYCPDSDKFEFPPDCRYYNARQAADIQFVGSGPTDSMINGNDGFLYTGSALGELYRINPRTGTIEYLGKPFPCPRLPGLAVGADGILYLCGGSDDGTLLGRYHRAANRFETLGKVQARGGAMLQYGHELAMLGNVAYIGETDNKWRSGYLWACEV